MTVFLHWRKCQSLLHILYNVCQEKAVLSHQTLCIAQLKESSSSSSKKRLINTLNLPRALLALNKASANCHLHVVLSLSTPWYCLQGRLGGWSRRSGRQVCSWHLDVCCHGDPKNIPHTAQCDIFNKVWLHCLALWWRCEDINFSVCCLAELFQSPEKTQHATVV